VKVTCKEWAGPLRINRKTIVNRSTRLGRNVNSNGFVVAGHGPVTIGDNFHCGTDCLFITQNHKYDDGNAIPYDTEEYDYKPIVIEDNVWLGSRVVVVGQVRIGEGAIVQAGSVVVKDVEKCGIVGGNPARQFKTRNIDHYVALKAAGKFC